MNVYISPELLRLRELLIPKEKQMLVVVQIVPPEGEAEQRLVDAATIPEAVSYVTYGMGLPERYSLEPGRVTATYRTLTESGEDVVEVLAYERKGH